MTVVLGAATPEHRRKWSMKNAQQLLPGIVIGVALTFLVLHPSESATWVSNTASWLGDVFGSFMEFLKQLIE